MAAWSEISFSSARLKRASRCAPKELNERAKRGTHGDWSGRQIAWKPNRKILVLLSSSRRFNASVCCVEKTGPASWLRVCNCIALKITHVSNRQSQQLSGYTSIVFCNLHIEASSNVNKVPAGENKKKKGKSHQQYSMASALINLFPELAPASHMVLISSRKVLQSAFQVLKTLFVP